MKRNLTLIFAAIAALGTIENSYAYGTIGALLAGQSLTTYASGQ